MRLGGLTANCLDTDVTDISKLKIGIAFYSSLLILIDIIEEQKKH
jgi:hypothetical protein